MHPVYHHELIIGVTLSSLMTYHKIIQKSATEQDLIVFSHKYKRHTSLPVLPPDAPCYSLQLDIRLPDMAACLAGISAQRAFKPIHLRKIALNILGRSRFSSQSRGPAPSFFFFVFFILNHHLHHRYLSK